MFGSYNSSPQRSPCLYFPQPSKGRCAVLMPDARKMLDANRRALSLTHTYQLNLKQVQVQVQSQVEEEEEVRS